MSRHRRRGGPVEATLIDTTDADVAEVELDLDDELVDDDLLVEEISIDGMCGVY
jgi:mycofactocin precursor